ncbi:hypothetical protein DL95DRAFT_407445 [Leptodontidium sp. 2 PMI_412]|nr:hypothetical protein DL95DRAFT_407445 [Leptodontidium sp. 2 PMI_412]
MAPSTTENTATETTAVASEPSSSMNMASCIIDPRKEATNKPQSKIAPDFLGIPEELRRIIFDHALTNHEIEIYDDTPNNPNLNPSLLIVLLLLCKNINDEVRDWLRTKRHLRHISFAGLFDPTTTIWKTDYTTIRREDPDFIRAWTHPVFQQRAEILLVDMPFDSSIGEDKWAIQEQERCMHIWNTLVPFPSIKRIDLLSHGKLEPSGKISILDAIWAAMGFCDRDVGCTVCEVHRPLIRWKNVNKINGKWREVKPWTTEERRAYDDKKDWVVCKRWGLSDNTSKGYDEKDLEDFSEEDDESDLEDIPEIICLDDILSDTPDEEFDDDSQVMSDDVSRTV